MAVKDRKRRRLVRLGVIRLGYLEERKRKNGSTYTFPRQSDHFLLHDAKDIQEFYAEQGIEEVRELDVLLPFPDADRNFVTAYQLWAGGVLVCEGDGEYVNYSTPFVSSIIEKKDRQGNVTSTRTSVKNATGDTHVSNDCAQVAFDWNGTHFEPGELVPCSGATQDLYPHCLACKLSCQLKVMMADDDLFRFGYYQISTSSGRNHDTIRGTLESIPAERLTGIAFKLRLVEGYTTYTDDKGKRHKGTRWFLQLEPDRKLTRKLYKRSAEQMIEAPVPRIADRIDHDPEWHTEDGPGYDGNGALDYETDPPAPPPFAEQDAQNAEFEEPETDSEPEPTYVTVPYPDGLSGEALLAEAVKVTSFKNVGDCMTVLAQVLGPEWRDKGPAAQWKVLDDHCASPADEVPE